MVNDNLGDKTFIREKELITTFFKRDEMDYESEEAK